MSLSIGIVGLPNVGKSTLFNALLKKQVALMANYPFATIEPNTGIVPVPDKRLDVLSDIVKHDFGKFPDKVTPAVVQFCDIAGLVSGAHKGDGLGNAFLSHIRQVDAIVHVVRAFEDTNIVREGSLNPEHDIGIINTELMLSDLAQVHNILPKVSRDVKRNPKDNLIKTYLSALEKCKDKLDAGLPARFANLTPEEEKSLKGLGLLTLKPVIYVFNVSEDTLGSLGDPTVVEEIVPANIRESLASSPNESKYIFVSAKIEYELATLSDTEAQQELMSMYGLEESGLNKVIRVGYDLLGLETFLTMGVKEVRAWTMPAMSKAPQAAGVIHTDFERGFISAEVISFNVLSELGSWRKAKELGKIRLEGKEYVMQDGDVVEFRFNV